MCRDPTPDLRLPDRVRLRNRGNAPVGAGVLWPAGWREDAAYSSGHMERPGLKRRLADIEHSRIDIVVVDKIDRQPHRLADFPKRVEVFERHDVPFVSVTQSFNTTTSRGRLLDLVRSRDPGRYQRFREREGDRLRRLHAGYPASLLRSARCMDRRLREWGLRLEVIGHLASIGQKSSGARAPIWGYPEWDHDRPGARDASPSESGSTSPQRITGSSFC
ncbi:hypothetical protein LMG9673_02731 [Ralstonia pseudosolanacearum]|nr:recombinase family protein [Ralstonia pseudosolanacearum]CAH0441920.1 hypothetical protein LMG9673_02731 [Ralstonia pseudosolanacearum]